MKKKTTIDGGSGISGQSKVDSTVWGNFQMEMREKTREEYMKDNRVKTLQALGKTKEQALKQAKHWFKMNPNRKRIKMKLSATETIVVLREDINGK